MSTCRLRLLRLSLLDHNHHLIRTGQILLADKGFAGTEFKQITDAMGLRLLTRITQHLLAMAAGIWHNWTTGVTSKRSLIAYDQ